MWCDLEICSACQQADFAALVAVSSSSARVGSREGKTLKYHWQVVPMYVELLHMVTKSLFPSSSAIKLGWWSIVAVPEVPILDINITHTYRSIEATDRWVCWLHLQDLLSWSILIPEWPEFRTAWVRILYNNNMVDGLGTPFWMCCCIILPLFLNTCTLH